MLIGSFDIKLFMQELILESGPEGLDKAERLLAAIREKYAMNDEQYAAIWIALTEAVTNAVKHGNKYDPAKKVRLTAELKNKRFICFTVQDEGEGFDPTTIADPTSPERITEPDGRGIFLIGKLADRVIFSDHGRSVEMRFELPKNTN